MSKNEYLVYVHIFPNGKQYVGMTKSAEKRWARKGSNYKYNERMYKDIQKFGWDNIQHLILHSGLSKKRAFELEAEETEKRKSYLEEYGYNVSISNARSGERNPMYGMSGEKSPVAIPVHQYDKKTCRGVRNVSGGYKWRYLNDNSGRYQTADRKT